jgi:endonuclease YncB( thermonuclease family)
MNLTIDKTKRFSGFTALALLTLSCTTQQPINSTSTSFVQASNECDHDATTFRCVKYVQNYDADTITVDIPNVHPLIGDKVSVRVNGIDTPEMRGKLPCEKEAARKAQKLIESLLKSTRRIDLKNVSRDKYFRVLADVEVDGKLMKEVLLKNHLAYEYHGETKQKLDWCRFTKGQ